MDQVYHQLQMGYTNDPVEEHHRLVRDRYQKDQESSRKKDRLYVHRETKQAFVVHNGIDVE